MSRIGRKPIAVPTGVTVALSDENFATVRGPKGELTAQLPKCLTYTQEGDVINVTRPTDGKEHRSQHGLGRTLLDNMIIGVSAGFTKSLEIVGIGYRTQLSEAQEKDKKATSHKVSPLVMKLGYSHDVIVEIPEGLEVEVSGNNFTTVKISGCDKQRVGQFAAEIRKTRPPEPYKGKGVRYQGEVIRKKEGKTGAKKK